MKKGMISVLTTLVGASAGIGFTMSMMGRENEKLQSMSDKHLDLFLMMNQWVQIKQEGKNLAQYFERNNYKQIAIYGMSYAGERLVEELKNTNIVIKYGIDKNAGDLNTNIKLMSLEDNFEEVDVVVVTAITFFDEIEEELSKKVNCPIVSLEDILNYV